MNLFVVFNTTAVKFTINTGMSGSVGQLSKYYTLLNLPIDVVQKKVLIILYMSMFPVD